MKALLTFALAVILTGLFAVESRAQIMPWISTTTKNQLGAPFGSEGFSWMPMMSMMWGVYPYQWGSWWFGSLLMFVEWVVILVVVAMLIRWILEKFRPTGDRGRRSDALDVLRERYARGEINKKEFEERKRNLE